MQKRSSGSVKVFYPRLDREELLRLLGERMAVLAKELPLKRVVLFGSYAAGTYTAASDIDLLVVYEGEPRAGAYGLVKRTLQITRLEPHVYAESEYEQVKTTIERMVGQGIELARR